MRIKIISTDGAIDTGSFQERGVISCFLEDSSAPTLRDMLSRLNVDYHVERLFVKDSLQITSADREMIKRFCEGPTYGEKILITHGTDTMIDTARVLSEITNKTIVLMGSSEPHHFRKSDAEFTIAVAIGALKVLQNGVYIATNGHVYPWDQCKKLENGVFVEKLPCA